MTAKSISWIMACARHWSIASTEKHLKTNVSATSCTRSWSPTLNTSLQALKNWPRGSSSSSFRTSGQTLAQKNYSSMLTNKCSSLDLIAQMESMIRYTGTQNKKLLNLKKLPKPHVIANQSRILKIQLKKTSRKPKHRKLLLKTLSRNWSKRLYL